jgi:hypothetical protein
VNGVSLPGWKMENEINTIKIFRTAPVDSTGGHESRERSS